MAATNLIGAKTTDAQGAALQALKDQQAAWGAQDAQWQQTLGQWKKEDAAYNASIKPTVDKIDGWYSAYNSALSYHKDRMSKYSSTIGTPEGYAARDANMKYSTNSELWMSNDGYSISSNPKRIYSLVNSWEAQLTKAQNARQTVLTNRDKQTASWQKTLNARDNSMANAVKQRAEDARLARERAEGVSGAQQARAKGSLLADVEQSWRGRRTFLGSGQV